MSSFGETSSLKFVLFYFICDDFKHSSSIILQQNENDRQQFKLEITVFNPNQLVFLHETVNRMYLNVTILQKAAAGT